MLKSGINLSNGKKIIFTVLLLIILTMGLADAHFLLTSTKGIGEIMELTRGSKNAIYAMIRFKTDDNKVQIGKVNAEGHKTGDRIRVMYDRHDPQGTISAFSEARFIVPVVVFVFCVPLIFIIWIIR